MDLFRFFVLFTVVCVSNGFLLDGNTKTNSTLPGTQNQSLTINDKFKLEQQLSKLKEEQSKALDLLAAQLTQTLGDLYRRIETVENHNDTCENSLMDNRLLKMRVGLLENRTNELEVELNTSQNLTDKLLLENAELKNSSKQIESIAQKLEFKLAILNQTLDLNLALLQAMVSINYTLLESEMHILNNDTRNEMASLTGEMMTLNNDTRNEINADLTLLRGEMEAVNNETMKEMTALKEVSEYLNRTIHDKQIVAVHSKAPVKMYSVGEIIKFTDFKTSIGLSDQAEFISSGKFTCTNSGLYLISPTLMTLTDNAFFGVFKNKDRLNFFNAGHIISGAAEVNGVFVIELQIGDTVYVKCLKAENVYGGSMLTIVKLN